MGIIKYKVVNCKYLTIRQRPTKESKAVAYLKAGDIVNVIRIILSNPVLDVKPIRQTP